MAVNETYFARINVQRMIHVRNLGCVSTIPAVLDVTYREVRVNVRIGVPRSAEKRHPFSLEHIKL